MPKAEIVETRSPHERCLWRRFDDAIGKRGNLMTHVILADDQAIFRAGVARVLSMEHDFEVTAQCETVPALVMAMAQAQDPVVVFSTGLGSNERDLLRELDGLRSRAVVVLEKGEHLSEKVALRVRGVVSRSVAAPQLIETVRRVAAGETCIPHSVIRTAEPKAQRVANLPPGEDPHGQYAVSRLTPKELQIVSLIAEGSKNREIARRLRTSEQVIKNYLRAIFDKIGVGDRLELALFALQHQALNSRLVEVRMAIAK